MLVNGDFTGVCFAETWLRATHNQTGEPTGAIATLMSLSTSWAPPMEVRSHDLILTEMSETVSHVLWRYFYEWLHENE